MSRFALISGLLLLTSSAPALAQPMPPGPAPAQSRAFSLKNMTGQVITSAQARTTDGNTRVLSHEPLQPNESRQIIVPRNACLDSVIVHLNDGRTLKAENMDDCRSNQLVVGEQGINVLSSDVQRAQRGARP